jgi:hypothetical protein
MINVYNMEKRVAVPVNFNSISDFSINEHTTYHYHQSKVTTTKVYYKCAVKNCKAKAQATLEQLEIIITEESVHNHLPEPKKQKASSSLLSFTKLNQHKTPSRIQMDYLKETGNAPPLKVFQNVKSNLERGISTFIHEIAKN